MINRKKKTISEFVDKIMNKEMAEINNSFQTLNINNEYYNYNRIHNQTKINCISTSIHYNLCSSQFENKESKDKENCLKYNYSKVTLKNYKKFNKPKNNNIYKDVILIPLSKSNTYQNEEFMPKTIKKYNYINNLNFEQHNKSESQRRPRLQNSNNIQKKKR